LHHYATDLYSNATLTATEPIYASSAARFVPRSERGLDTAGGPRRIRVGIIGATGYVGGELVRLLARHPDVEIVGLVGRDRDHDPIGGIHPHLATTGLAVDRELPGGRRDSAAGGPGGSAGADSAGADSAGADSAGADSAPDAIFMALPHGAGIETAERFAAAGTAVIDLGPDFRLRDAADYPRWYGFEHPRMDLLDAAVYGLPELHRSELEALVEAPVAIVGSPGCYPTATLLALAPLARAGLIGDLVVDAKSGVSGAGREAKPGLLFGEVNESVSAYGIGGHRHVAEIEQELAALTVGAGLDVSANPGSVAVDFLPHLIPMTRGILSACHVRPTRAITQAELDELYAAAYADEPFVTVVAAPPATKQVTGSNHVRVHISLDERTGRILAIGVIDNLVKGAAGQAIQAFNLVHGLPETAGLEQLPLAP
jgi:N-acetyl-gamma-glutamyl-phosphate reductase